MYKPSLPAQLCLLEFFFGHVGGIKVCTSRFGTNAVDKGLIAVQPIPRSVVDPANRRSFSSSIDLQQVLPFAVGFVPKTSIHDLGRLDQQRNHLFLLVCQRRKLGRQFNADVFFQSLCDVDRFIGNRKRGDRYQQNGREGTHDGGQGEEQRRLVESSHCSDCSAEFLQLLVVLLPRGKSSAHRWQRGSMDVRLISVPWFHAASGGISSKQGIRTLVISDIVSGAIA